jgi:hypothetical protein
MAAAGKRPAGQPAKVEAGGASTAGAEGAAGNSTKPPDQATADVQQKPRPPNGGKTLPSELMLAFRRARDELVGRLSALHRGVSAVARLGLRVARCGRLRFG